MIKPQVHIPLTPFDHCVPRAYYNGAFYLSLKSGVSPTEAFALLHEGLHRTFLSLPWLSGRVYLQSSSAPGFRPGQAEIRHDAVETDGAWPSQLKFKELDTATTFDDLKESGFPPDAFRDNELIWSPFLADISSGHEVFVAQANFLPGGCIVTAAIHHAASDETAFIHVFKLWSDNCKQLQRGREQIVHMPNGSDDRSLVDKLWKKEKSGKSAEDVDPKTWMLVGLDPRDVQRNPNEAAAPAAVPQPSAPLRSTPSSSLKAGVFYISPASFSALQKDITKQLGSASGVSGNDAICALIWRCLLRARMTARKAKGGGDDDAEAYAGLNMVCDGRPNFSASLPQTYLGNITFNVQSKLPLSKLTSLDEGSIATAAATIRTTAGSVVSENLLDLYTLLSSLPDFDDLARWKRNRASSIDGNNMSISSMIMFPIADVCFGDGLFGNGGTPEAIRPLMEGVNAYTRICFVLPKCRNGGVEFVANLSEEEMQALMEDEEFEKYALCLCWS